MTVDTLHPTAFLYDLIGGGQCFDGPLGYDGDPNTYARIVCDLSGQYASIAYNGYPVDATPASRTSVIIRVRVIRVVWSDLDQMVVFFRKALVEAYTEVAVFSLADLSPTATWVEVDVTALAGSSPATGFQTTVRFWKGAGVGGFPFLPFQPPPAD